MEELGGSDGTVVRLCGHSVELCSAVVGVEFFNSWTATGFSGKSSSVDSGVLVIGSACADRAIRNPSWPIDVVPRVRWNNVATIGDIAGDWEITRAGTFAAFLNRHFDCLEKGEKYYSTAVSLLYRIWTGLVIRWFAEEVGFRDVIVTDRVPGINE